MQNDSVFATNQAITHVIQHNYAFATNESFHIKLLVCLWKMRPLSMTHFYSIELYYNIQKKSLRLKKSSLYKSDLKGAKM